MARLVNMAEPIFDSATGHGVMPAQRPSSRAGLIAAIAAAVVLLVGGGIAAVVLLGGDKEGEAAAAAGETPPAEVEAGATDLGAAPAETGLSQEILAETGFDLFVDPGEGVKVKLDGKRYDVRLPMQVRNIAPGDHVIEVEGPPGFFSKTQTIKVEGGKAPRMTIELDAIEITGRFNSTPPGALVVLVSDGQRTEVGETPIDHALDPRKRYEIIFEKRGYVTQTKPIVITGRPVEPVEAVLEKAGRTTTAVASRDTGRSDTRDSGDPGGPGGAVLGRDTARPDDGPKKVTPPPQPAAKGNLLLGSKPPCKIYIDGRNTGLTTPQRNIELSAGSHKITLINNEHNIKETFKVTIKSGDETRVIKDLTSLIK